MSSFEKMELIQVCYSLVAKDCRYRPLEPGSRRISSPFFYIEAQALSKETDSV